MAVNLENYKEVDNILTFTLHVPGTAYSNAIRRVCMSSIPATVFKTFPYESNQCEIKANSTRSNNEIIKQRLSCIPIHIPDVPINFNDLVLELDVQNNSNDIILVTTEHFKVKDTHTNNYLDDAIVRQMFPPFIPPHSGSDNKYYIEFIHLYPKISENISGEHIKLSCLFSTGTSAEDGSYNMVSTLGVGFTPDRVKMAEELEKHKQEWRDNGKSKSQISFDAKNWELLEGLRYVIKNSYDFTVETVGTYSNNKLMILSCEILLDMLLQLYRNIGDEVNPVNIKQAETTIENCFDVALPNDTYTISNILNSNIIDMFYQNPDTSLNTVSFIGVKKMHPHAPDTLLRIAYFDKGADTERVRQTLIDAIEYGMKIVKEVKAKFDAKE